MELDRAVERSDPSYEGVFFVGVRTTGIFCRPSCPARKPLPRNRVYFATANEALRAGYRPCKRCRPTETNGRQPDWVGRLLATVEGNRAARLCDRELRALAIDPARARRFFNQHYGMTFQAYCRRRRMGEALQQIQNGARLDDVALGNGYGSHSGFREAFQRTFGKPPGESRQADCIVTTWFESPLGPLLAGAISEGICLLEFADRPALEAQHAALHRCFQRPILPGTNEHLNRLKQELGGYFTGELQKFGVPLVFFGSPFQQAVWKQLLRIPYGKTCSYEDVARAVHAPKGQRAVGRANGQNRIAIVVPCHRVVNKGRKLGGYGGGLWRKQFLLDLERGRPVP